MKITDSRKNLRGKDKAALREQLIETKQELFNLRFMVREEYGGDQA